MGFRPTERSWELDDPGRVPPDGLQLLTTGAGGAAGRRPRGVPGGRGGRSAGWELDGESLRALGRHVTQRVHRALHLGVQKALGVVVSHYQVDLEAVSTGYVVPVGVDDEVAMNRADALAAPAADILAEDFMDFLFPDAPPAGGPQA